MVSTVLLSTPFILCLFVMTDVVIYKDSFKEAAISSLLAVLAANALFVMVYTVVSIVEGSVMEVLLDAVLLFGFFVVLNMFLMGRSLGEAVISSVFSVLVAIAVFMVAKVIVSIFKGGF